MSNQFTLPTISGYNASAPSDDASATATNQVKWQYHIEKIGDPIKTLAEALGNAVDTAFDKNFMQGITSASTTYTVALTDRGNLISCTSTFTMTMLPAVSATAGFMVCIYNAGSGVITVDGNASETINGDTTLTLNPDEWAIIQSDASNWKGILGGYYDELKYLLGVTSNIQDQIDNNVDDDHDHAYDQVTTVWATATAQVVGDKVQVASGDSILYLECTTAGTTHATTEPIMPSAHGGTIADNSVTWTARDGRGGAINGYGLAPYLAGDYQLLNIELGDVPAGTTPTKIKEYKVGRSGTLRLRLGLIGDAGNSGGTIEAQIYLNGATSGTLNSITGTDISYTYVSDDVVVRPGDLIQLYTYESTSGESALITTDFYIMTDNPIAEIAPLYTL